MSKLKSVLIQLCQKAVRKDSAPPHTHKHQQVIKFIRPNIIAIRGLVSLKVQIHFSLNENKSLHSSEPEMVSDCTCCFVL